MWNLIHDEHFVLNTVGKRGRHTRGTAVDVTLVDKLGRELPMPSDFADFSEKAAANYHVIYKARVVKCPVGGRAGGKF